jgi:hypothetical protein
MLWRLERWRARGAGFGDFLLPAILLACIVGFATTSPGALAQGPSGLMVSPTRVVFEGRTRSARLTLLNPGTEAATYRIAFKNLRMREDGTFERIEEPRPGQRFAHEMIRYAPRQVVLEPGVQQTVRILLRKPRDLEPGEYRSHLEFLTLPPATAGADIEAVDLGEGEIRVAIRLVFGLSIPVIVRQGELSASVTLTELALETPDTPEGPPLLSMRLNRSGDRSVYGDITVTFRSDGGAETEVGLVRGIAVYTPNESRIARVPLRPPEGVTLTGGRLHVAFSERAEQGGVVRAEAEFPVP